MSSLMSTRTTSGTVASISATPAGSFISYHLGLLIPICCVKNIPELDDFLPIFCILQKFSSAAQAKKV